MQPDLKSDFLHFLSSVDRVLARITILLATGCRPLPCSAHGSRGEHRFPGSLANCLLRGLRLWEALGGD